MELTGWNRTFVLALGGFAGVMITAYLIHVAKGGTGQGAAARRAGASQNA